MKTIIFSAAVLAMLSCNEEKKDSVEAAESSNEQKTEQVADTMASERQMNNDNEFVVKAASCGLMEVELGQLASQKATNASVKDFAQMMVKEHSKVNDELKQLAATKNLTIPTRPGEDELDHINKLSDKTGKNFDEEYMDLMVEEHKDDIDRFEKASNNAKDADIKAFATKHLASLRAHHEHAKTLKDKLK